METLINGGTLYIEIRVVLHKSERDGLSSTTKSLSRTLGKEKKKLTLTSSYKIAPSWADLCPVSHKVREPVAVCSSCTPVEQPSSSCLPLLLLLLPVPPTFRAMKTPAPSLHRWRRCVYCYFHDKNGKTIFGKVKRLPKANNDTPQ